MPTNDKPCNERVVKVVVKNREGTTVRSFYSIHDPHLDYWMSRERFDGPIWTRDSRCRREFASRAEAQVKLEDFLKWRQDHETEAGIIAAPANREAV